MEKIKMIIKKKQQVAMTKKEKIILSDILKFLKLIYTKSVFKLI